MRIDRHGVGNKISHPRTYTPEKVAAIRAAFSREGKVENIARDLGISITTAYKYARDILKNRHLVSSVTKKISFRGDKSSLVLNVPSSLMNMAGMRRGMEVELCIDSGRIVIELVAVETVKQKEEVKNG